MLVTIMNTRDFVWAYVLPFICACGLVANSINFLIFSERKRLGVRNKMHQYLQVDSLVEFIYLLISLFYFVLKSNHFAAFHSSYAVVFFEKYFFLYFTTSLAIFMVLLRLFVSIRRLLIVFNTGAYLQGIHLYRAMGVFAFISLFLDITTMFTVPISPKPLKIEPNSTNPDQTTQLQYFMNYQRLSSSPTLKGLIFANFSVRGLIAPTALLVINILIILRMKKATRTVKKKLAYLRIEKLEFKNCKFGNIESVS